MKSRDKMRLWYKLQSFYFRHEIPSKVVGVIIAVALGSAISWGVICLAVWLICLCFGLTFNILHATGIWIALLIIKGVFRSTKSKE